MDDNDRKRIIEHIDELVSLTDFDMLCQLCLKYKLLNDVMLHNIQHTDPCKIPPENCNDHTIRMERHKSLFVKITKRGPDAYKKLRQIFTELKYEKASKILFDNFISINSSKKKNMPVLDNDFEDVEINNDQENNQNDIDDRDSAEIPQLQCTSSNDNNDKTLHEYKGKIEPKKCVKVRKATKIWKHPNIPTYPMESEHHRGVLFTVNIIDFPNTSDKKREGAEFDTHALLALFEQMNFKLYAYENLTQKEFFKLLDALLQTPEIKLTECFVMALMTHGELEKGIQYVKFHDGAIVNVEEIEKRFYHENCTQLVNKPKILIFPYCRGTTKDEGVLVRDKTQTESINFDSRRTINNIVQLSDVIKCYATRVGFVSHRDPEVGSWYIQHFVDTIAEHAHNTPFEDMLKIVQTGITKKRTENNELQTPSYNNIGFNKILYFNPGFFKK